MSPITHAFLPLLLGYRWIPRTKRRPSLRISALVAFSGALPDMLSPHLSLDERHAAASHSLVAWLAFTAAVGLVCAHPRLRRHRTIAVLCIGAYGTHIFCDLITGGGPLFSPLVLGVYGGPYLPFWSWIVLDGALLAYVYLVYRWLPLRRRIIPTARTPAGGEIDRGATTIRNIP